MSPGKTCLVVCVLIYIDRRAALVSTGRIDFWDEDFTMLLVLQVICAIIALVSASALMPRSQPQKIRVTNRRDSR
jgi:hypothetical protein